MHTGGERFRTNPSQGQGLGYEPGPWLIGRLTLQGASQRREVWEFWNRRPSSTGEWRLSGGTELVEVQEAVKQLRRVRSFFPGCEPQLLQAVDLFPATLLDMLAWFPPEHEVWTGARPLSWGVAVVHDVVLRNTALGRRTLY